MSAQVPLNIGAPNALTGAVVTGGSGLDLTTVSAVSLLVRRPDGTQVTWAATLAPAPAAWAHGTAYALNALVQPNPSNGLYYKATAVSGTGTSAGSPPPWPTEVGSTVVDNEGANQITWTCIGPATSSSQLSWSHAFAAGDCTQLGVHMIAPQLTVPGGTVPCPGRPLLVVNPCDA